MTIDFRKFKISKSSYGGDHVEMNISQGSNNVAIANYFMRDDGTAVIEDINVATAYNGMGLGRFLVSKIEADLKTQGFKYLYLEKVQRSAVGFWKALGYYPPSHGLPWRKPL